MRSRRDSNERSERARPIAAARRDLVVGSVMIASILLLLASGWRLIDQLAHSDAPGSRTMIAGVALNLALVLFGWQRHRALVAAMGTRAADDARAALLARRDELTGLLNRRTFAEEASNLLRGGLRRERAMALLAIDLDHFKTVNEIHGPLAGDVVLREIADIVRRMLPATAVAGRLDGDRFAVALPCDPRHEGTAETIAAHIVGTLAQPIAARGIHVHVGASIGIARSSADGASIDALLRRATIAVRAAKTAGRGRAVRFDESMERELVRRNAIEAGLREGIPAGRFVPYYEQQIALDTGALIGFEVLARWEHPTDGIVLPDAFIPIAEESGLIGDLSVAVMRRAFTEARDWDASLTLSVNISPAQLKDPWLAQKIVKLLVETGFPANRLEIEITESALLGNLPLAQSIVGSLKNQGIRLALDDFGTGYSSLAHLRALPFDRIKIDRSFVTAMIDDPESAAIVDAITRLGESLDLPITAEGIEDGRIAERLAAIGCAKGQGWHYGKPMPVSAARRLLAERSLLPAARSTSAAANTETVRTPLRRAG